MVTHTFQALEIYTVYYDPLDVPGKYVIRKFLNEHPTKTMYISDTLEGARSHIPKGMVRLPRMAGDGPKILETWI